MSRRIDQDVTLSHEDAKAIAAMLSDHASTKVAHAKRTRSPALRACALSKAEEARRLANEITRKLWSWT